jgi:hypothetical protein
MPDTTPLAVLEQRHQVFEAAQRACLTLPEFAMSRRCSISWAPPPPEQVTALAADGAARRLAAFTASADAWVQKN